MIGARIVGAESSGNPLARNPRSSAFGAGQFINSTWLNTLAKHRPDLVAGRSREEILALRADPQLSRAMVDAHARDNAGALSGSGLPVTPGTTYLAHFAGPQGAESVLRADPSAPVGGILGDKVVAANPFLRGMTASDLVAWADKKMGGEGAASEAPTGGVLGMRWQDFRPSQNVEDIRPRQSLTPLFNLLEPLQSPPPPMPAPPPPFRPRVRPIMPLW